MYMCDERTSWWRNRVVSKPEYSRCFHEGNEEWEMPLKYFPITCELMGSEVSELRSKAVENNEQAGA
jgi:hypothetical protein